MAERRYHVSEKGLAASARSGRWYGGLPPWRCRQVSAWRLADENLAKKGDGGGRVSEKTVENGAVPGFGLPGRGWDDPSRAAGVARDGKYERYGSKRRRLGVYLSRQESKRKSWFIPAGMARTRILDQSSVV